MKQRIMQFIESLGISISQFERACGLANGTVSKMGYNTRMATLDKISKVYPLLSINWLRTGEGTMINSKDDDVGQNLNMTGKSTVVGANVQGNGNKISNTSHGDFDLNGMIKLQNGYQSMLMKSQSQIDTLILQNKQQFDRMMAVIEKLSK